MFPELFNNLKLILKDWFCRTSSPNSQLIEKAKGDISHGNNNSNYNNQITQQIKNVTFNVNAEGYTENLRKTYEHYMLDGTPEKYLKARRDLTQEQKKNLFDDAVRIKKGRPAKKNPFVWKGK